MVYTSYFAQLKNLPNTIAPIAICGKSPDWYTGLQYKKLAPKIGFFQEWKKTHDNDYYVKCFYEQVLSFLTADQVMRELNALSGGKDVALLCYEKPGDFCHRHIVSEWLNKSGYDVHEYCFRSFLQTEFVI